MQLHVHQMENWNYSSAHGGHIEHLVAYAALYNTYSRISKTLESFLTFIGPLCITQADRRRREAESPADAIKPEPRCNIGHWLPYSKASLITFSKDMY